MLTLALSNRNGRNTVMWFKTLAIAAATVVCTGSLVFAQTPPAKIADTSKGKVLVDSKGMTLYTFDKDAGGKSM